MRAEIYIDNGDGIHLAVLEGGECVYLHRFDNIDDYGQNCRTQLGECVVALVTDGYDDGWDGNDLDGWPEGYRFMQDHYDVAATIELGDDAVLKALIERKVDDEQVHVLDDLKAPWER